MWLKVFDVMTSLTAVLEIGKYNEKYSRVNWKNEQRNVNSRHATLYVVTLLIKVKIAFTIIICCCYNL